MKEYIVLTINENNLIFNYRRINNEEKKYLDKEAIYKDSFYYTIKYFKKHTMNILTRISSYNIEKLTIDCLIAFKLAAVIVKALDIKHVNFNFKSSIALEDYKLFLSLCIHTIDCYYMPNLIKRQFETRNTVVNMTCNSEVSKKFLEIQNASNQDELYYKKSIDITADYQELILDIKEFLSINYDLNEIHIYVYSKELISSLIDMLKNDESRHVIIYLHQSSDKGNFIENNFEWLKNISESCNTEKCEFRIIYSNTYFKNKLFKQLTFNNIKLLLILCVYIVGVLLVISLVYNYIQKYDQSTQEKPIVEKEENPQESEDNNLEELKPVIYNLTSNYKKLKKLNKNTVGYISIKGTKIAYPVLQYTDNHYYMEKDFYNKDSHEGWIYLDYRNNTKEFSDNNIIYGNDLFEETMFGTLKNVFASSYRKDENNMIVSLNILNKNYKFKIFSAYKTEYETDYLQVEFDTKEDKKDYINKITERSLFESDIIVGEESKILTLSTYIGTHKQRIVVHAVLMKEE